jgi:hypothetical protein
VLRDIAEQSMSYEGSGGIDGYVQRGTVIKHMAGIGLVITSPSFAWRGQAPFDATGDYAPATAEYVRDDGDFSTAVIAASAADPTLNAIVTRPDFAESYYRIVIRDTFEMPWTWTGSAADRELVAEWYFAGSGNSTELYTFTIEAVPYNLLIGQEITATVPMFGAVTGAIQSVSTTFADGFDQSPREFPLTLSSGNLLNSGTHLDDTQTLIVPRRLRNHTITIAGRPRTFLESVRSIGA